MNYMFFSKAFEKCDVKWNYYFCLESVQSEIICVKTPMICYSDKKIAIKLQIQSRLMSSLLYIGV